MKLSLLTFAFLLAFSSIHSQAFIDSKINAYKADEDISVVIVLKSKADISKAKSIKGKEAKANYIYENLYNNSINSQKNLLSFLENRNKQHRSFYIVNMISAKINKATISEIAQMSEVESILEDGKFVGAETVRDVEENGNRAVEWGITKIKADSVWLLGNTGQNVIIGGQDTGYDWDHPALINKYKGWNGTTANHNYHWHDAIHNSSGNPCGNNSAFPCDDNNHGTHTMGTMVGDDGAGNQIGVAPGAKWIACRNMDEGNGTLTTYVECFEWFLAPYPVGGNSSQGDPNQAPHVINNSWGCPPSEGCNTTNFAIMEAALNALRDAGTVVVVSAGNSGPNCSTVNDPAAIFDGSFSVGATQNTDVIANFSSRGHVTVDGSNRAKPDISAPGVGVRSSIIGTGYASFNGTSMAGPHVAGLVALIISANPNLAGDLDQIENIIRETALPRTISTQTCGGVSGLEVPNNTYGYGRIDALKAVKRANDSLYIPLIKVDQFGYLPIGNKVAILSNPITGYNSADSYTPSATIKVKNALNNTIVFTGSPVAWNNGNTHSQSGDKVWWFDFSAVTTPGTYYISDGGVRSENFEIHADVYKDLHKITFNNFYHQRCGCPKFSVHVGDGHDDVTCHSQDNNCRFINEPNNPSLYRNMNGGWHDAGDYNKYVNFAYNAVIPLLSSYEYNPQAYNDSLNIPESGNGIPDLLDEVKYELDWLLKMQASDGGIHCVVGVQNFASASPPSADLALRFYGPKTTSATFSTSAMLAFGAIEYKKINNSAAQIYANTLQNAAVNAWNWGNANPSTTFFNTQNNLAAGEQEVDAYERSMRKLAAAIYLYALTKDNTYKTFVESNYPSSHLKQWSFVYPFEPNTQLNLLYYSSLQGVTVNVATDIKNTYSNSVMNTSDNFIAVRNKTDAYRSHLSDGNHVWGSNAIKTNMGNIFQTMNHLNLESTKKDSFILTFGDYLHYIHGANPTGLCYLTNMSEFGAENSINTIYHGWFNDGSTLWDDVRTSTYGPPAGILSGGVNPSWSLDGCCQNSCSSNSLCINQTPPNNQPILKSYKDWNTGWPQNSWEVTENSIAYQASYLFLLSAFVNNSSVYAITPIVSNIENSNVSISTLGKGFILRSPDQTMYRVIVNNNGVINTEVVPTLTGHNTKLNNNTLNLKQSNSGIIIKSPNNSLWKIAVDNGGNLSSLALGALTSPITKIESGDLVIDSSLQGILFKDNDNECYYLSVDNAGKLLMRVVECEE